MLVESATFDMSVLDECLSEIPAFQNKPDWGLKSANALVQAQKLINGIAARVNNKALAGVC